MKQKYAHHLKYSFGLCLHIHLFGLIHVYSVWVTTVLIPTCHFDDAVTAWGTSQRGLML